VALPKIPDTGRACVFGTMTFEPFIQELSRIMGPSIYDVHTEGAGSGSGGCMWTGSSPMWTSTQKIKIRVHWCHPVFFLCKEVGVFFLSEFSLCME